LNGRVLVLNQSYEPISVCSPRKAISLLYMLKADMVIFNDSKNIRTINHNYEFPSVIKLSRYIRIPFRSVEISRKNILRRDNNTCQYCGSKNSLTIDHIIPKSRHGGDSWENLVTACVTCNNKKGNRTPFEAKMILRTTPQKPNYIVFLKNYLGRIEDEWKPFLYC